MKGDSKAKEMEMETECRKFLKTIVAASVPIAMKLWSPYVAGDRH